MGSGGGSGADALGRYLVTTTTNAPANAFNLGALTTGLMKMTVSAGTATPSTATAGTDYVAVDATLTSLAAYNTAGMLTQTAADTFTGRTITGTANSITVTNGSGVSGNPTLAVADADHGDITTSASGATWTIDNLAITSAKIADATVGSAKLASAIVQVTTTPYTFLDTNRARLVSFSGSAAAVTLPVAGGGGEFTNTWFGWLQNRGANTVTITPTTSTIDGAATLVLTTGQGVGLWSDGTNYFTSRGAGGSGCNKYTVGEAALTAAALTQSISLFTLPDRAKVTGVTIKHSTAFSGPSITAVNVSLGQASGSATAYTATHDIFQTVSNTAMLDDGGHYSASFASHGINANFTSVGANLSAMTAGSVDIWVCTVQLP
jgi:hypothetical protein